MTSDLELVARVQNGQIEAFEELVRRYQKPLLGFASRIVWDRAAAEEVVQDALFAVYKNIERFDMQRKFSTWVFEIAKNKAISRLRQRKPGQQIMEADAVTDDESMYDTLAASETGERVKKALAKLPNKYHQVIKLYYFDDLAYEEIASKLKLPLNTVRTNLRRGKIMIKTFL